MDEPVETRVLAVIEESGMAHAQFAAAVGMDPTKLSKSLAGRRRFTSLELARVADVGRRSVDWLITGAAPFRPVFARRVRSATVDDDDGAAIVERVVTAVRGLAELDRRLVLPPLPQPAEHSSWYTVAAPRLAQQYVQQIGVPLAGLATHELFAVIERTFGIVIVVADLPDDVDGLSYEDADARVIVLATADQPLRQRFTLAHELAHIAFGDARQGMLEERMWTDKSKVESRANAFAAAFLAPSVELRAALAGRDPREVFPELVERFQLSPSSLAWRLLNERLIDQAACDELRKMTAKSAYLALGKPAEFVDIALAAGEPRPGWLLVNAYADAYRDGETTIKPVARLLGWAPDETEEFFATDGVGEDEDPGPGER
ncbi:Zn-dependent peptidase ImmA (M78 family) [Curtobacterium sp. 320]|uniref:ImmA/IrrE family metallo-endopeptidase n=1 Tax=Curtobacterium sp. 320 TaxID=2817749 RepID=UPI002855488C|nr:ImmA/IrrE family metallo-endopeptidase [Curtobacterium sp. 320]MDR6573189.1 Zn-dependent peptidase ImmA (M78 family) [Curtobacterium sp. 320]